jgi:hypothetical protein
MCPAPLPVLPSDILREDIVRLRNANTRLERDLELQRTSFDSYTSFRAASQGRQHALEVAAAIRYSCEQDRIVEELATRVVQLQPSLVLQQTALIQFELAVKVAPKVATTTPVAVVTILTPTKATVAPLAISPTKNITSLTTTSTTNGATLIAPRSNLVSNVTELFDLCLLELSISSTEMNTSTMALSTTFATIKTTQQNTF